MREQIVEQLERERIGFRGRLPYGGVGQGAATLEQLLAEGDSRSRLGLKDHQRQGGVEEVPRPRPVAGLNAP